MDWKVGDIAIIPHGTEATPKKVHSFAGQAVKIVAPLYQGTYGMAYDIEAVKTRQRGWAAPKMLVSPEPPPPKVSCPKCRRKFVPENDYVCKKCRETHL